MKLTEKVKVWLKTAGIGGLAFIGGGVGSWILFGSKTLLIAGIAIFIYINANVIWKLATDTYKKL